MKRRRTPEIGIISVKSFINPVKKTLFQLLEVWLRGGQPKRRTRLGIFKADGIGDFVLSSEAIRQLLAEHGANNVCLIVSNQVRRLAAALFPEAAILTIVPGHAALRDRVVGLGRLRSAVEALAYDEIVCLRHYRTTYEDTILRSFRAKRIVLLPNQSLGYARDSKNPIPNNFCLVNPKLTFSENKADNVPREWQFHAAALSMSLGRHVAAESMRPNWDSIHSPNETQANYLLISPLAGRGIRDLPPNLVNAAARKALERGLDLLLLTGTSEQAEHLSSYAESLRSSIPGCRVVVVYPPDLPALVRLVASAALVCAAESSTAHIATALDRPTLVLIGGGHFGWFAPWRRSAKQVWLTHRLPCFDCNWHCPYPEPFCITNITNAQVAAALPAAERA